MGVGDGSGVLDDEAIVSMAEGREEAASAEACSREIFGMEVMSKAVVWRESSLT